MEELIVLSNSIGFESKYVAEIKTFRAATDLDDFLFMSELKKHLRDKYNCIVQTFPESKDCWFVDVLFEDIMSPYYKEFEGIDYNSKEEALKEGLIQAMKSLTKKG